MAEDGKSTVRAVERALDILLCFTTQNEWAMTEIAENVGLHKSTVHRMLATLEERGFVVRDPASDRYRRGCVFGNCRLICRVPTILPLSVCRRWSGLAKSWGRRSASTCVMAMNGYGLQAVQSSQAVRRVAPVGARMPLYVGASSKVLLAFEEAHKREELLMGISWPDSFDKEQFREQLEEIRRLGYATSVEEREQGAAAVSAPIFTRAGRLVAALSVSGPANRLTLHKMREQAPSIIEELQPGSARC